VGATHEYVPGVAKIVSTNAAVGVTLLEAALAPPVPAPFVAVTVNVYAVPAVNPVTVIGEPAPEPTIPPGDDVTT
jgi:hypothetical protein